VEEHPRWRRDAGENGSVFTAFGEKWAKALRIMREEGVLERAVWVAPLNEAPLFLSMTVPSIKELVAQPLREGLTELEKTHELDAIYQKINHYMAGPIKAEIERDGIPLSYSSLSAENYAARLTDLYDVVDVHFMPAVITDEDDRVALEAAGRGTSGFPAMGRASGGEPEEVLRRVGRGLPEALPGNAPPRLQLP
jgi:hypothetical protein